LTQETAAVHEEPKELFSSQVPKTERKKQATIQELVESFKSTADDIGQISELSSEEKMLVGQFFSSLLKLMGPLAPSMVIDHLALPAELGDVVQAHIDPTGHLILEYADGHIELKNLIDEKNRDIMIAVIEDVMPKFKSLTSQQKRKIESRLKLLSGVTKEIQKSSEALSAALSSEK